ncbi:hypothetical protein AKJ45_03615 [candidate division MSBL1 archaeon SCGC-AAA261F19]|uniref:PIN domain-containing protein n=1 Tax=candidate division MSBL1 archaeon SCGC-AAA261F19 TaxID=1698275 RepID=A0A133V738_9EURY|nr:hypothetical protein AKJ45_03615 [candidate division MSBL1 archaeon SCGC-AAA261F19]
MKFFLDTSAWVKRYLVEEGTREIDDLFEALASEDKKLFSSLWNIGECLGVFDERRQRGDLTREEFEDALRKFFSETLDLAERGDFELMPISGKALTKCWKVVVESHVCQADALQLASLRERNCDVILTGDGKLAKIAKENGFEAIDLEIKEDRAKLRCLL